MHSIRAAEAQRAARKRLLSTVCSRHHQQELPLELVGLIDQKVRLRPRKSRVGSASCC